MGLLTEAKMETAFLKCGIQGFTGAGKTYTATSIGIELCKLEGKSSLAFFDTEKASDFQVPRIKAAGLKPVAFKGRAFADLMTVTRECESSGVGCLIIDSISHVWRDLMDSYKKRLNRKAGLFIGDWDVLKTEWNQFSTLYINSKLHIVMCGRAGYNYDEVEGDDGRMKLVKSGTKMKVESELGHEPDLLLEMERIETKDGKIIHRCYVLKDRTDLLDGKEFDDPTFEAFKPYIQFLNIGGEHNGVDTSRNSEDLFDDPDYSASDRKRRQAIAIEQIKELLILNGLDGSSNETKKARVEMLIECFGTSAQTAIETMHLDKLLDGIDKLKAKFKPAAIEPPLEAETEPPNHPVPQEEWDKIFRIAGDNGWEEGHVMAWINTQKAKLPDYQVLPKALAKFCGKNPATTAKV